MKSAIRRHHYHRLKKNRKWYWFGPQREIDEEERLGKLVDTPHPCSCPGGCGHMREFNGPSVQERRAATIEDWLGEV